MKLDIGGGPIAVGRMAVRERRVFFAYEPDFVVRRISLSPFHLRLDTSLQEEKTGVFDGLFGLFHDSLPDGWGRLLLDRAMERAGVSRGDLTPLHRLACVGRRGMGALIFEPELRPLQATQRPIDLDAIAASTRRVLAGNADVVFRRCWSSADRRAALGRRRCSDGVRRMGI